MGCDNVRNMDLLIPPFNRVVAIQIMYVRICFYAHGSCSILIKYGRVECRGANMRCLLEFIVEYEREIG
jgi:hypothetical protein